MTQAGPDFLTDLNDVILRGSAESRAKALWHATDTLMEGSFTEDQIWVFGEVIGRLVDEIEQAARVKLSRRLAHAGNAPVKVITMLAFDDSIEVAGPVLQHSPRLDTKSLIANIRTKSQPHLLAISRRDSVPVEVSDELVTRGNQEVVQSVVANEGASFSNFAFQQMIKRSESDSVLAERLGLRKEIPGHLFRQLIAKASEDVRRRLERERPGLLEDVNASVSEVVREVHFNLGVASKERLAARQVVAAQLRRGRLHEKDISDYALAHKFDDVVVGLSLLFALPEHIVERTLVQGDEALMLMLCKALGFGWDTAMALLFLGAENHRISAGRLDRFKAEFERADPAAARGVLRVCQSRANAASTDRNKHPLRKFSA